jgi:hypothetical protein
MDWRPLPALWKSFVASHGDAPELPAVFGTPARAWDYGAATNLIRTTRPAKVRLKMMGLAGRVGVCLVSEDYSRLLSEQHMVTPQAGEAVIELTFLPENSPARVALRNFDDEGQTGEILIGGAIIY